MASRNKKSTDVKITAPKVADGPAITVTPSVEAPKAAPVKGTEVKAREVSKPVSEEVSKPVVSKVVKKPVKAKKTAAKTKASGAKKDAVKRPVGRPKKEAAPANAEVSSGIYFQYDGNEISAANIEQKVKEAYKSEGHRVGSIHSLKIYINANEGKAYYVVNGKPAENPVIL